jgi:hypothetical protein
MIWSSLFVLTGKRIIQPVRFEDWTMIGAYFPAPTAALQQALPSPKLKPAEIKPGVGLVHLRANDYRRVEIFGAFKELHVNIPVVYEAQPDAPGLEGDYILQLPLTSEEGRFMGVHAHGYPKFLASIDFKEDGDKYSCQVSVDGKHLITLEVEKAPSQQKSLIWYEYTIIDKKILRTPFQHLGQWGSVDSNTGASFVLGDHPHAKDIACLGMEQAPVRHEYAPQLRSILQVPEKPLKL